MHILSVTVALNPDVIPGGIFDDHDPQLTDEETGAYREVKELAMVIFQVNGGEGTQLWPQSPCP